MSLKKQIINATEYNTQFGLNTHKTHCANYVHSTRNYFLLMSFAGLFAGLRVPRRISRV